MSQTFVFFLILHVSLLRENEYIPFYIILYESLQVLSTQNNSPNTIECLYKIISIQHMYMCVHIVSREDTNNNVKMVTYESHNSFQSRLEDTYSCLGTHMFHCFDNRYGITL